MDSAAEYGRRERIAATDASPLTIVQPRQVDSKAFRWLIVARRGVSSAGVRVQGAGGLSLASWRVRKRGESNA